MGPSLRIGRIFGIEIAIHISWLIIAFVVTVMLALNQFPRTHPGWDPSQYWAVGGAAALLFFASVLAHEISHALVAERLGIKVKNITLFIFGGAAQLGSDARRPRDEAVIAAVGPLTSLVVGAVCFGLALVVEQPQVNAIFGWLAFINVSLAVFNLLPGFPMDGGRILRAIIWTVRGDAFKATQSAALVGRAFGYLFIGVGVFWALQGGEGFASGLWLALIGWFLSNAAESAVAQMTLQRSIRGVRVQEVMDDTPPSVSPNLTIGQLVHEHMTRGIGRSFLVQHEDGILAGIITLTDVQRVPRDAWETTRITDIMTRFGELATVRPGDSLEKALNVLQEKEVGQLPVIEQGREAVGLLTRTGILRLIDTRLKLGL